MESARVTINLTPADLAAFNRHCLGWNSRWGGLVLFVVAIVLFTGGFFAKDGAISSPEPANTVETMLLSLLPIAIFLLILFFFLRRQLGGKAYEDIEPDLAKPIVITFTAEGVHEESATHVGTFKWAAIKSIEENAGYLFLMVAKRRGIVIPKRCFATAEEAAIFANQARVRSEQASTPAA